jgi:hypothetical protein
VMAPAPELARSQFGVLDEGVQHAQAICGWTPAAEAASMEATTLSLLTASANLTVRSAIKTDTYR